MAVQLLKSGPLISLQDFGRFSGMNNGIPISGVMDKNLFIATNKILGHKKNLAALEIFLQPFEVKFTKNTFFSIGAYDADIFLNKTKIEALKAYQAKEGDLLRIQKINKGVWSYFLVKNGFITEEILGSQSYYPNLGMETFKVENDILAYKPFNGKINSEKYELSDIDDSQICVECTALPEFYQLSETVKYQLLNAEFTLSNTSNRQAYRLKERLKNELSEITTGVVLPGSVQFTSGGHLMILMRDSQVTGGYPRVLQIKEDSLSRLSQMRPNAKVSFKLFEEF